MPRPVLSWLWFLPLLALARNIDPNTNPYFAPTVPFTVKQVPGAPVYYVIGQSGVPGADNQGLTSNAGFVVTREGVVVYDALGTPGLGYRLLQEIRQRTDQPVTLVVAGHYHADHIYGLQAFQEHTRATIWAHADSALYLNDPAAGQRLAQRRLALDPWVDDKTRVVAPNRTFQDRHTFEMGNFHIELIHLGPAHSPDDTIMVVKEAGVVFSGDLIFDGRLPFLGPEVNTENWLARLTELQKLKPPPRFLIPGHGEASANPAAAIGFTRDYLTYLRQTMGKAAAEFLPFDEAYAATDWSRFKKVATFEATNRGNAYQVYLEMERGALSEPTAK